MCSCPVSTHFSPGFFMERMLCYSPCHITSQWSQSPCDWQPAGSPAPMEQEMVCVGSSMRTRGCRSRYRGSLLCISGRSYYNGPMPPSHGAAAACILTCGRGAQLADGWNRSIPPPCTDRPPCQGAPTFALSTTARLENGACQQMLVEDLSGARLKHGICA
jgi:hypothetical protein